MIRHILPILIVLAAFPVSAAEFAFKDGDRVVLIGSTLIEREQRYGYWEAALTAANPDKNITFRNLGWSGDTVWGEARAGFDSIADGYKRLIDHVKAEKPTVIIVGYGTNESFAGPAGLPKFKEQLKKLLDDLAPAKARLVMIPPMPMAKMPPPLPDPTKANENLKRYGDAIAEEAKRRGSRIVEMNALYAIEQRTRPITDNGLHLTAYGYSMTSLLLELGLGFFKSDVITVGIAAKTYEAKWAKIIDGGKPLTFRVTLGNLPIPISVEGGEPIGGPSFCVEDLLEDGKHGLNIDGKPVTISRTEKFALGTISSGPDIAQGEKLRQTIIAKNELYFHRWRPQNITYLFGFRKHEQGNNAIEIPQFDPLIEEKEKEIAKLRKPVEHVYELVPAKK